MMVKNCRSAARFGPLLAIALAWAAATGSAAAEPLPPQFPSEQELRARYAIPASQFAEIAGETVHYVEEGKGPAILLLHGSFASLRQWDGWAATLSKHYRVVRYDQSPLGLSGPSPQGYELDHRIAVIDGLMDRLGIERFVIVGTSSAGVPAAAYAAARPDRVKGVILSNIATGPVKFDLSAMPQSLKDAVAEDMTHPGFHKPEYWRQILLANVVDQASVTPALAQEWTDLNNRALRDPAVAQASIKAARGSMSATRTPQDLAAIKAPTLVLWSSNDVEVPLEREGQDTLRLLGAADKRIEVVPRCGHMMPLDCPDRSVAMALPFLRQVLGK